MFAISATPSHSYAVHATADGKIMTIAVAKIKIADHFVHSTITEIKKIKNKANQ